MTADDLKVRQVMWAAAQYSAQQLELTRRDDIDNLWDGQLVMVATPNGMNIGKVKVKYSQTETSRHEHYYLNDVLLYEHSFDGVESVWGEAPKFINHLPDKVVVFVEYTLSS